MAISFYDISIETYRQALAGVTRTLAKARTHFDAAGTDPEAVVETSLYPDMKPFRFQIRSVAHHTLGAIEGLRAGTFSPPGPAPAFTFAELCALVADTTKAIEAITAGEMESLAGGEILFVAGDRRLRFKAPEFVLSFSVPNVFFHATTAYDILRMQGVPLEKVDYLARPRFIRD